MHQYARLRIQLAGGGSAPVPSELLCNEYRGGPNELLNWLEIQLGLIALQLPQSTRISQYSQSLEAVADACFARSLERDCWATTSELLARRDALLLAGWNGKSATGLPRLVSDLGRVEEQASFNSPGEAERIKKVMAALDEGQTLPLHCCELSDPLDQWPWVWRQLLAQLSNKPAIPETLAARESTALGRIQRQVQGEERKKAAGEKREMSAGEEKKRIAGEERKLGAEDASFCWLRGLSIHASCEAVAAALSAEPAHLPETVICCEQEAVALCLDESLSHRGLPTMGARCTSPAHPALQVLPLMLNLCWDPVDPGLLLDFLSLPISPIPRRASRALTKALASQPGLGSQAWEAALAELLSTEHDPDEVLRDKLLPWLQISRSPHGEPLPLKRVEECCQKVARWAGGYAGALRTQDQEPALSAALEAAAGQASLLRELATAQGETLSEPQLKRLLEASRPGASSRLQLLAAGGPRLVSSLAEINTPCQRLIWMGLGTEDGPRSPWSRSELDQLQQAGIQVDDGSRALAALRSAQRRGLCQVQQELLAISLPTDLELRPHPVWLQIRQALGDAVNDTPPILEQILSGVQKTNTTPWIFPSAKSVIMPPQPPRPLWQLDPALLREREQSSASSLETRLACPLKWVLQYQARIKPSAIATLPSSFQLKGTFCHAVLAQLFGGEKVSGDGETQSGHIEVGTRGNSPLPTVEQALQSAEQIFDQRLPLDAAPLAQPELMMDRHRLKQELLTAVRVMVEALSAGGYRIKSMERQFECSMKKNGRRLRGSIDCLASDARGNELVIDFKYGGVDKYRDLLETGRATQLATYAFARSIESGSSSFPQVAYLVLSKGLLFSLEAPPGAAPHKLAAQKLKGPDIKEVWTNFSKAIAKADTWLSQQQPIPARPLQEPEDWPTGVELILKGRNSRGKVLDQQPVCNYCDYGILCGHQELM